MKSKTKKGPFFEITKGTKVTPFNTEEIVLDHTDLQEIGPNDLKLFVNLAYLYVPNNNLLILNHLEHNSRLCFIDARNNQITDIDFSNQDFIHELYLSNNKLQDLDKILSKIVHLRELEVLDLRNNPLTLEKGYRQIVIQAFPLLKTLDGINVSSTERPVHHQPSPMMPVKPITRHAGKRPSSVLELLQTRPLSAADASIRNKASQIRKDHETRRMQQIAKETAIARKQKDEFEAAAKKRSCPIPDAFKETMGFKDDEDTVVQPVQHKRPSTRMFLKRPKRNQIQHFSETDERLAKLNPNMPRCNTRLTYQMMFPDLK